MARPRIEGMFYFPHDCNAHSEPEKIEPLMLIHGLEGYAHFFILLEMIYLTPNGRLDISQPEKRKLIARKMFCKETQFDKILKDEIRFGLFDRALYEESGILTSTGIARRRETVLHERTRKRQGYSGSYSGNNAEETADELSQNTGERGGKGKGKEKEKGKRESKTGNNTPRCFEEVAFSKAETAWTQFDAELSQHRDGGRLTIRDDVSRKIFYDLGGHDQVLELHGQNGDKLREEFVTRYAVLDVANFKAKAVS